MKSKFPGYFKLTQKEIDELWANAIIALDANILLNLYRYSDETREDFFKIFEKIKERVWIPNQAAFEFFNNRLTVISQQEKAYEEAISSLNDIESEFKNSRQHPFLSKKLLSRFSKLTKEICTQLNSNKEFHNKRIYDDDILDKIESLFDGKVGDEFTNEELENIYTEGEKRFSKKIPPGYKDANKKDELEDNQRIYGDFIVWKQIVSRSKDISKGVILVTDDRKEDWWVRFSGKTLGPRPELIREFRTETEQYFHMYQSDRFLEFARDYLDEEIDQRAIDEIRELRKLDERNRLKRKKIQEEYHKYKSLKNSILNERRMIQKELSYVNEKKDRLEEKLTDQYVILENSDPSAFDEKELRSLKVDLHELNSRENLLKEKLEELDQSEIFLRRRRVNFIE